MLLYLLAFVIGIVAGLRAMTAPAAVSWAASLGWLSLEGSWLAFLGFRYTPWILTLLAVAELVADQHPATPSRTVPVQLATRLLTGGASGAALGYSGGSWLVGSVAGVAGALLGTFGGRAARAQLAEALGRDRPAALIEDALAIGVACLVMVALA